MIKFGIRSDLSSKKRTSMNFYRNLLWLMFVSSFLYAMEIEYISTPPAKHIVEYIPNNSIIVRFLYESSCLKNVAGKNFLPDELRFEIEMIALKFQSFLEKKQCEEDHRKEYCILENCLVDFLESALIPPDSYGFFHSLSDDSRPFD